MGDILRKITEILSEGNNIEERRGKWIAPTYPDDREFIYKPTNRPTATGANKGDKDNREDVPGGVEKKNIPPGMSWQEYYEKNKQ